MYREVNPNRFSKTKLARLGSIMLLAVFAVPHLKADGRWFEVIEPARSHPRNLYESQIRYRRQSRILSQRNH